MPVSQRVSEEIALLKAKYGNLEHNENLDWILVPDFQLPRGRFNKERSRLFFLIPAPYPNAGPDNFFVDGDLRLIDGTNPPGFNQGPNSSNGSCPIPGNWGWFSWHPVSWRPSAKVEEGDNLMTFLRGVNQCLQGIEAT